MGRISATTQTRYLKSLGFVSNRSTTAIHRYEFQNLKQSSHEAVDNFLTKLTKKKPIAGTCTFKGIEERIVDQLIWRCAHSDGQKSFIDRDTLNRYQKDI